MAQISPSPEAVELMERGISNLKQLGWMINQVVMGSMLAESYLKLGKVDTALRAIEARIATVTATGEANFRPELFRVQGECFRSMGDRKAAEHSYRQALALAQQRKTKSLELRAATRLSLLWAEQGKRAQAYELLSNVYNWFTEGFNTADLRQAKELLQSLSP
jgi:tetratricopeptide (TPR) repeat protein